MSSPLLRAWERRYGSDAFVAVGGHGSGGLTVPTRVLRLPHDIGAVARSLEATLARPG